MDKSSFGTSMLAYHDVRGQLANASLIESPRGHPPGCPGLHLGMYSGTNSWAELCTNMVNIT